jgi:hypothetical protein
VTVRQRRLPEVAVDEVLEVTVPNGKGLTGIARRRLPQLIRGRRLAQVRGSRIARDELSENERDERDPEHQ